MFENTKVQAETVNRRRI